MGVGRIEGYRRTRGVDKMDPEANSRKEKLGGGRGVLEGGFFFVFFLLYYSIFEMT